jgi:hypothetical protein
MRGSLTDVRLDNVRSARQTTRVIVDVEVGSDPISGHADVEGKRTERFVGWTALAVLLEAARTSTSCGGPNAVSPEYAARE